jgi:hypothetical protein
MLPPNDVMSLQGLLFLFFVEKNLENVLTFTTKYLLLMVLSLPTYLIQ